MNQADMTAGMWGGEARVPAEILQTPLQADEVFSRDRQYNRRTVTLNYP